jgi:branched-chain amino acid transport system ATP-binding protein
MSLLAIKGLEVKYGHVIALQSLSLEVDQGEILAVLGRNGAGKSSLMKAIAGDVRPSNGKIIWDGTDISRKAANQRVRSGIALVPEGRRIFPHLTVGENLRLGGFYLSHHEYEATRERVLTSFPVLKERIDAPAGQLSGGQQQMLAIGRALMSGARLLLLDEPSLGLAPLIVDEVYAQLENLHEQGLTLIVVEQQVQRALQLADSAIVLNLGQVVLREDPARLINDPRLVATYMGESNK